APVDNQVTLLLDGFENQDAGAQDQETRSVPPAPSNRKAANSRQTQTPRPVCLCARVSNVEEATKRHMRQTAGTRKRSENPENVPGGSALTSPTCGDGQSDHPDEGRGTTDEGRGQGTRAR